MVVGIIGMFFVGTTNMLKILGFFPEKTVKQREYKKHASYILFGLVEFTPGRGIICCSLHRPVQGAGLGSSFGFAKHPSSSPGYPAHHQKLERPRGKMRYLRLDNSVNLYLPQTLHRKSVVCSMTHVP